MTRLHFLREKRVCACVCKRTTYVDVFVSVLCLFTFVGLRQFSQGGTLKVISYISNPILVLFVLLLRYVTRIFHSVYSFLVLSTSVTSTP